MSERFRDPSHEITTVTDTASSIRCERGLRSRFQHRNSDTYAPAALPYLVSYNGYKSSCFVSVYRPELLTRLSASPLYVFSRIYTLEGVGSHPLHRPRPLSSSSTSLFSRSSSSRQSPTRKRKNREFPRAYRFFSLTAAR